MNGISSTNEEMRKAQRIVIGKPLNRGDLVQDLGLDVMVMSQWNSAELGENLE